MANKENKDPFESLPSIKIPDEPKESKNTDPFESLQSVNIPDEPKAQSYSELESAGLGALQGATLGFGDEIEGGVRGGYNKLTGNDKSLADLYSQYRDIARQRNEQAQSQNPKSYFAGEVGGGGAAAAATGGLLTGPMAGLRTAALLGGAAGIGNSNAQLGSAEEAKSGVIGAGLGAGGHMASEAVGNKLAGLFNPEARSVAANKAASSALDLVPDERGLATGAAVLKQGLPLTGGSKAIGKSIQSGITQADEQELPGLLQKASDILKQSPEKSAKVPSVSDEIQDILDSTKANLAETETSKTLSNSLSKDIQPLILQAAKAEGNPLALNEIKQKLYTLIKTIQPKAYEPSAPDLKPKIELYKSIANALKTNIEQLGDAADQGLGRSIKETNSKIGNLIQGRSATDKLIKQDLQDIPGTIGFPDVKNVSPSKIGVGAGLGYAALHHPAIAGAALAGKMGIEKATEQPIQRAAQIALAKGNYELSNALLKGNYKGMQDIAKGLAKKSISNTGVQSQIQSLYSAPPEELRSVSDSLMKNDSTKNLGDALNKAVEAGDQQAINAATFAIMQNPNSRKFLVEQQGSEDEE